MRGQPAGGGGAGSGSHFQHGARWRWRRPRGQGAKRRPLGSLGLRGPREAASAREWRPSPPSGTPSSGPCRPATPTRAPPGPSSASPLRGPGPPTPHPGSSEDLSEVPLPARDLCPSSPPLTPAHRDPPTSLPAGGGRPHLPRPGEDPLRQRPCHLQRLPGDHEGIQKPEVPMGPLPTPGGRPRAEEGGSPPTG